jgi:choline-glycine betaine transporter
MEVFKLLKYLIIFIGTIILFFIAETIFRLIFHKDTQYIFKKKDWKYILYYFLTLCVLFFIAYWTFPNIFLK